MPELNELYSKKFENQLGILANSFDKFLEDLDASAKGLSSVTDGLASVEKTRENLNKQMAEAEKIKQSVIKTETDIMKKQKEAEKILQEKQKTLQAVKKTEQEIEKIKQQKIRTQAAENKYTRKQTKAEKTLLQEYRTQIKTAKDAINQSKRLLKIRKNLDVTSKHYEKKLKAVNKLIARNNELTKAQSGNTGKTTSKFSEMVDHLGELNDNLAGSINMVKGLVKQFMKLLLNPVVAMILAVVAAIKLLSALVKSNTAFMKEWGVQVNSAKDSWRALAESMSDGRFIEVWKKLRGIAGGLQEIGRNANAAAKDQIIFGTKLQNNTRLIERLKVTYDDTTLSFKEREDARAKAEAKTKYLLNKEIDLSRDVLKQEVLRYKKIYGNELDIDQIKEKLEGDELQRFVDLQIKHQSLINDKLSAEQEFAKMKRELDLDNFEQELDYIIDVADKRKTANEKILADTNIGLEERQAILDQTEELMTESFDQQVELFNKENDIAIDTNKLLTLNNKESFDYVSGLGLSERATNRLLEVIRERITMTSDLSESQKALNKEFVKKADEEYKKHQKLIDAINLEFKEFQKYKTLKDLIHETESENHDDIMKWIKEEEEAKQKAAEEDKKRRDQRKADINEGIGIAIEGINTIIDMNQMQFEHQTNINEMRLQQEIMLAGESEVARRSAERRFAIEKAKIDRKQAQSEKKQALFNIAISTAENIAKVAHNPFLIAAVIYLGSMQALAVSRQPLPAIPAFDKGSASLPSGILTVAEKRPEIITKGRKSWLQNTPLITDQLQGAKVLGGQQTEFLMNHNFSDKDDMISSAMKMVDNRIKNIKVQVGFNNFGEAYVKMRNKDKVTYSEYYKS